MYNEINTEKFIVFKVADYLLALSINNVLKVVNCSDFNIKKLTTMGLVQVGKHMIKLLDLHQHLSSDSLLTMPDASFLVVTCDSQGQLCGVLVNEPPDLIELPLETIRPLPKSDSYSNLATDMVSHVVVLSHKEAIKTIFLLDLKGIESSLHPTVT
ncbi:chemotaxis protein CheW [Scytonema sp. NUACC21]